MLQPAAVLQPLQPLARTRRGHRQWHAAVRARARHTRELCARRHKLQPGVPKWTSPAADPVNSGLLQARAACQM
jgi:hypothetical protein